MLVLCFMPDESNTCSLWGLILWSVSALSHGSLLPSVFSDNWLRTHFSRNSTWRILKSCFWEYSSRSDFCLFLPGVWKFFIFFFVFLPYTYNFSSPKNERRLEIRNSQGKHFSLIPPKAKNETGNNLYCFLLYYGFLNCLSAEDVTLHGSWLYARVF